MPPRHSKTPPGSTGSARPSCAALSVPCVHPFGAGFSLCLSFNPELRSEQLPLGNQPLSPRILDLVFPLRFARELANYHRYASCLRSPDRCLKELGLSGQFLRPRGESLSQVQQLAVFVVGHRAASVVVSLSFQIPPHRPFLALWISAPERGGPAFFSREPHTRPDDGEGCFLVTGFSRRRVF